MLSRVANSIYWMCRYIERAENVARFIDVNLNLLLDMPADEKEQWSPLIMTTGDQEIYEKTEQNYTQEEVIWFLTFDRTYPNSILSCVSAARENARSIREIISSEMWEHLNNFYLELIKEDAIKMAIHDPNRFFKIVKMRSHLLTGLLDSTMSHGEAWNFARIGMMVERADKTSRILDVKYFMLLPEASLVNAPIDNIQWISVLRSASAFEMYRKEFHRITPQNVANFLIFNRLFPRSIYHCLSKAQVCLHRITGSPIGASTSPAEKRLGRLMADLEYTDIHEVIDSGLHEFLDSLQTKLNLLGGDIGTTFFNIRPLTDTVKSEQ
ncbi:alpha-E domain-containing protein [Desulforhopalus sp. IMCC35007]|uniref:alpha-E domain-containing protein n=1 Tax=Desulforhopalus sp. IMCC35007 TaxID=2569543 RepID=UPI0010AE8F5E|nr:alpha-E domain-containing protein [Desulforhopalus sp. IMCC35007]TKB08622.1 alpha-E domain-containing protein [Desulforhopalus sp. IMCC35007]